MYKLANLCTISTVKVLALFWQCIDTSFNIDFEFGSIFKKHDILFVRYFFKGGFFQKLWFVFQISKNKYLKELSWAWNLNFLPITVNNKFKFQAQDSNLEYFSFWNWEIWKTNHTFWIKATFTYSLAVLIIGIFLCWSGTEINYTVHVALP